jgi:hypothetical protein
MSIWHLTVGRHRDSSVLAVSRSSLSHSAVFHRPPQLVAFSSPAIGALPLIAAGPVSEGGYAIARNSAVTRRWADRERRGTIKVSSM